LGLALAKVCFSPTTNKPAKKKNTHCLQVIMSFETKLKNKIPMKETIKYHLESPNFVINSKKV
jgi:hypothetical protein